MLSSQIVKKAHKMTKEIKNQYPEVDYRTQFGLCLSYLLNMGGNVMVELKGTEKQVKWANDIRNMLLEIKAVLDTVDPSKFSEHSMYGEWYEVARQGLERYINENEAKVIIDKFAKLRQYMIDNLKKEDKEPKKVQYIAAIFL